ncbi:MAG: GTPase [Deltaproteobacteria bacterium RIFOXYA12_FULL_61_11]|nr:MAG: GTPase [Deltaproteobacteria bacterium RIFOXYA12_FULL_61_11]
MSRIRTIIMGAAGRDFHNFNVFFRTNRTYEVVAFTATQIPGIEGRRYPAVLAGELYPNGIPIEAERDLDQLIKQHNVQQVVFAYSDVSHEYVMHLASRVNARGADFVLMGTGNTMIASTKPVISICAVRTGSGKSQTTRRIASLLKAQGKTVAIIRHPMPYGDLARQAVQRFSTLDDLVTHQCTIEEREEYEHHLEQGMLVYAGVDYERILRQAEQEADVILWDGGNNDTPFYRPDLEIVVVDPHRPTHADTFYPGETNLRRAHVIVINKIDTASPENIATVRGIIERCNPKALVIDAASPLSSPNFQDIRGKRVLVVEDGPTLTHGHMRYGAGTIAAKKHGAKELIDPRPFAVGEIATTFKTYPDIGILLPAMGYGAKQIADLQATIAASNAEVVVIGTPIDLSRIISIKQPTVKVGYSLQELGSPTLAEVLTERGLLR